MFNARILCMAAVSWLSLLAAMAAGDSPARIDQWVPESPREELKPDFATESPRRFDGVPALEIRANGKDSVNGWWTRTVPVSPGRFYEFRTLFQTGIEERDLDRKVLARVIWLDADGGQAALPEYPPTLAGGDWKGIRGIYQAPAQAVSAKLELVLRWVSTGSVLFRETAFEETDPPESRKVKVAAVHFRPVDSRSARENLEKFAGYIEKAGAENADIVLLPEGITLVGTGKSYLESAETIPGPSSGFLSEIARKNNLYLVANIYEREEEAVYNTSILLDRRGQIAGKYRKVSLPREEIDGGLTPGKSFPVFDTDFGRIGLMTCWDVFFPESARSLAGKGAEIIFLPIWGGNLDLARARAIENQVYLVSSTYDMKTGIFNREGKLIVEGSETDPVAVAVIDLEQRTLWPWLGDFRSRIRREKPPADALD